MIDIQEIKTKVEELTGEGPLFVVDVKTAADNVVEVTIDSDNGSVGIEDCMGISRAVTEHFDRDQEDFELTVTSAGIGQPLRTLRQYRKLHGKTVEVILKNGLKIIGTLVDATPEAITVSYQERMAIEGSKRKKIVEQTSTFPMEEIKLTREHLDYK